MTDTSEALFVIKLPAGTKTVPFAEVCKLIGIAITQVEFPNFDPNDDEADDHHERLLVSLREIDYKEKVARAAKTGELEVLDSFTLRPLELPIGAMLENGVVRVSILRTFIKGQGGEVELQQPTPTAPSQEEVRIGTIDWQFWRAMRKAKDWQACALSLNVDPDTLQHHPQGWMAGPDAGPIFTSDSFKSKDVEEKFEKRLRLLRANRYDRAVFTLPMAQHSNLGPNEVLLSEFVAWGLSVGWNDMSSEFAAFGQRANFTEASPPFPQPSPVINAAEWDALMENEDTARQDSEYKAKYDRAASL